MWDACGVLFLILAGAAFLTGAVHGLWVICRAMFGGSAASRERPQRSTTHPAADDSDALWQQAVLSLRRLFHRGLLTERLYQQIRRAMRTEREQVEAAQEPEPAESEAPDLAELERQIAAGHAEPEPLELELPPAGREPVSPPHEEAVEILEFERPEEPAPPKPKPKREPRREPRREPEGVSPRRPPAPAPPPKAAPTPAQPAEPAPPRDWSRLLHAFMEEKNIRWGELVSGMLIVGSAIGLVISLWSTLQKSIPYFPALLFMLATAAIHGAGVYTLRRWNLKSTSRGLLLISTLLIPLNFLAAIALSTGGGGEPPRPVTDPLYIVAVVVGLLSYGVIAYSASRIFRKQLWWTMWPAVMLPCIGQLIISRQATPDLSVAFLNVLALLPVAGFVTPMAAQLRIAARGERFSQRRATETYRLLGIGLFSLLMALGLLVAKTESLRLTLAAISPALSIVAVMITAAGLLVHHRATHGQLATTRTAGTTIALCGAAVMLIGLALAWPRPELLVAVGIVDVAALTALALTARLPALHLPAIAAGALTVLTAVHWWQGTLVSGPDASSRTLIDAVMMGRSSLVLLGVGLLCALGMRGWRTTGREEDAQSYLWGAAGLGAVSLLVAFYAGFVSSDDAELTTPVFALAAVSALVVCRVGRQMWAAYIGGFLTLVTFYHAFVFNEPVARWLIQWSAYPRDPFVLSALLTATITAAFAFVASRRAIEKPGFLPGDVGGTSSERVETSNLPGEAGLPNGERWRLRERVLAPLVGTAFAASLISVPQVLATNLDSVLVHAGYLFWIAGLWGSFALTLRSREALLGTQLVSFVAIGYAAVAVAQQFEWWPQNGFDDARYWQLQFGMQAVWCLVWTFARRLTPGNTTAARVLGKRELGVDHFVLGGLVGAVAILCIAGVSPGVLAEFHTPENANIALTRGVPDSLTLFLAVGLFAGALLGASFVSSKQAAVGVFFGGLAAIVISGGIVRNASRITFILPPDHAAMFGWTVWLVIGLVAAGLVATFWDRVTTAGVCGLIGLSGLIPVQLATQFGGELTTASWLRWGLAVYSAAVIAAMALLRRGRSPASGGETATSFENDVAERGEKPGFLARQQAARIVALSVALWPLLMLTMVAVTLGFDVPTALTQNKDVAALFRNIGLNYAIPLWVLAGAFVAAAIVERRSLFAIAASPLIQLGVLAVFVLPVWQSGASLGGTGLIELIQWLGMSLGACSLAWLASSRWIEKPGFSPVGQVFQPAGQTGMSAPRVGEAGLLDAASPFGIQLLATAITVAILPVWAAVAIVLSPERFAPLIAQIGDWKSFAALGTAATAAVTHLAPGESPGAKWLSWLNALGVSAIGLVPMIAAAATNLQTADAWLAYHTLVGGWKIVMLGFTIAVAVANWRTRSPASLGGLQAEEFPNDHSQGSRSRKPGFSAIQQAMAWALPLGAVVVLLGIRAQWDDPQRPWWLVGAASAAAITVILFGLLQRKQIFAYASGGLVLLATTAALSQPWIGLAPPPTSATTLIVLQANLIALSGIGLFWLAVELVRSRTRERSGDWNAESRSLATSATGTLAAHHFAGGFGLLIAALMTVALLFSRAAGETELIIATPMGWGVVSSLAALLFGSLCDRRAGHALPALYLLGLVAALVGLDSRNFDLPMTWYGIGAIAAGYALLTGLLWRQRPGLRDLARRVGVPESQFEGIGAWLTPANVTLAAMAVCIHFWAVFHFNGDDELRLRLGAALATALLVPALACLADDEKRAETLRFLTLSAAVIAAVQCVWSLPQGDLTQFEFAVNAARAWTLERAIRLLEVAAIATLLYAVGSWKLLDPNRGWGRTMRNVAIASGGLGLAVLAVVLGMEGLLFPLKEVPVTVPQIVAVAVILVALSGGLIVLAVVPGRDPLRLSETGRMGYVYAAELVASLLFLHVFLTKPVLFGRLRPYWPYIVIGIAYVGVGLQEWFGRMKLRVLSEPLRWTASFLPLLPAIAFWTTLEHRGYDEYSLILFLIGLAYVVLAMWRGSFGYALAAAFVGNAALWSLLSHYGLDFVNRPQLWLIPPALSVLVAGQLNRKRLSEGQLTSLRYLCVTVIYVSSTGEMFIKGAGKSLWHPMILAGLSVAGILAGMLMRIRAFLYLGASFLFLAIVSMVWHAAQAIDHVWPWWVFGIVLGIAILALFGVFEKKRNEVLRVVGRLREWER